MMINERKRQIAEAMANMEEIENLNWEKEMQVSRARGELEKVLRQINSVIVQQDIQSLSGNRIALTTDIVSKDFGENQAAELNEILRETKNYSRRLEIESQKLKTKLDETRRENEVKEKLKKEKIQQVSNLDEEINKFKADCVSEEGKLDEKLSQVKAELHKMKIQERGGAQDLTNRLKIAHEKLEEVKTARAEKYQAGQDFLKSSISRAVQHFEDCNKLREKTAQDLEVQIRNASSQVGNIANKISEDFDK